MDLNVLQAKLRAFASERSWTGFHTPKNLSMALMVEAAELMELFQWKTPEESRSAALNAPMRARIGEELADVLLYLLQLADHTGVDLDHAVADKLEKNAKKHPLPTEEKLPDACVVTKPVQTHVLVDWENVQPKEADIRALVPDVTHVWIFHGPNQKRIAAHHQTFGDALTLVPITGTGRNSLDFHLSYYLGYISSRNPDAQFVVVANDQGYGPMLAHAKELGFSAKQIPFQAPKVVKPQVPITAPHEVPVEVAASAQVAASQPLSLQAVALKNAAPGGKSAVVNIAPLKKPAAHLLPAAQANTLGTTENTAAKVSVAKAKMPKNSGATAVKATTLTAECKPREQGAQQPWDNEKTYARVLTSLQKNQHKPTRKARLYGVVKSLLGAQGSNGVAVEGMVHKLMQEGHVAFDSVGLLTKTP
jgi:NTP pyrophosphatase (non-canonical NTP hydrolase)